MSLSIDLNCDLGEGFALYRLGEDEAMLPLITSANVACGFHAGDADVMDRTVRLAKQHGVAVGAHPSFPDRQGFGRREMRLSPDEIRHALHYQLGALEAFCRVHDWQLRHVKPHGALYNMAAREPVLAEAVADAVAAFDARLVLYALAGSRLADAGRARGLAVAEEFFADRAYGPDGALVPRGTPGAVLDDPRAAAERVVRVLERGSVEAIDGSRVPVRADTVCLHSDTPAAIAFAQRVRAALAERGVRLASPGAAP